MTDKLRERAFEIVMTSQHGLSIDEVVKMMLAFAAEQRASVYAELSEDATHLARTREVMREHYSSHRDGSCYNCQTAELLDRTERQLADKSAEFDRLRGDAERYRWLREQDTVPYPSDLRPGELQRLIVFWDDGEKLDAAIDAARGAKK